MIVNYEVRLADCLRTFLRVLNLTLVMAYKT